MWLRLATNSAVNAAITGFWVVLISAIWIVALTLVETERADSIRAAIARNDNLAIAFEQYTIRIVENADAVIQYLIRAHVRDGRTIDPQKLLADATIDNKAIIGVVLADARGDAQSTAYSGRSASSLNVADREHFKFHVDHDGDTLFIGKPVIGRVTGQWVIPVTRRINNADGTFGGVAMALVEPRLFTSVLNEASPLPQDIISLVGLDGITRARLTGKTESRGEDIRNSLLFVEQAAHPVGSYSAPGSLDGIPRFVSYRTLPGYRMIVSAGRAEADAMAGFYRRRTRYFWAAGLASAVIAGFAMLLLFALAAQRDSAAQVLRSEGQFRATFEQAAVGISHTSLDRRFLLVNQKFCDMLGYTRVELLAKRTNEIAHPDDQDYSSMKQALAGGIDTYSGEMRYVRKDGSALWVNRTVSLVRDNAGQPLYFIRVVEDISERKHTQSQITYLAQYDALTGLPNRNLFRDRLALAIARAQRNGQQMALMFLDLDRFKEVNDALGHTAGDEVLQSVAGILRASLRDVDTIARLGGDEFTVILEDVAQDAFVLAVAEKIKRAFAEPLVIHGKEFAITVSIGIGLYPRDAVDAEALLKAADVAMYAAKDAGRNAHVFYAPEMNAQADQRLNMAGLLRRAVERGEFVLHYQPKVLTGTRDTVGVEALIRWNSPELGFVSPAEFIPLAEHTGLIVSIGAWVLKTACAQAIAWQASGIQPLLMSVNLSPRQLRDGSLVDVVAAALADTGLHPALLEFEITESVVMENIHQNVITLKALERLGVKFAIDDFGTGHSSLAYLTKLPVHALKIDRSFIVDMLKDANSTALVSTILTMARSLRLKVIAEGVETEEQRNLLRLLQCDQIQGFLISRPLPAEAMTAFLGGAGAHKAALKPEAAAEAVLL